MDKERVKGIRRDKEEGHSCQNQFHCEGPHAKLPRFFIQCSSENSSDIRPFWSDMSDIFLLGLICLICDEFCLISDHISSKYM